MAVVMAAMKAESMDVKKDNRKVVGLVELTVF
jgi:hypothetical protein